MTDVARIGIIGTGVMGAGIAELIARNGHHVVAVDPVPGAAAAAAQRVLAAVQRSAEKDQLHEPASTVAERIRWTDTLDAVSDCSIVIEAVVERAEIKRQVFEHLDTIVASDTILATNTSSIAVTPLAAAVSHPDRVVGLHFFNPPTRMPLVEVITTVLTSDRVADETARFAADVLNKRAIHAPDRPGFVVNALLVPFLLAAARMAESGLPAEDIDAGLTLGAGHPMGPLRLLDLIGLDTIVLIADSLFEETKDPATIAPTQLRRMVQAGRTGRKSGAGYYEYG